MDKEKDGKPIVYQLRYNELEDLVDKRIDEKCSTLEECPILNITKEEHDASHRFLLDLQKTAARLENLKWGVSKAIVIGILTFAGSAFLIGAAFIFKMKAGGAP